MEENLEKACSCRGRAGADLALFPEMWSMGYRLEGRPAAQWKAEAIPAESPFVQRFGELAAQLQMAVGITLLEQCGAGIRNTLILFDRWGQRKLTYAKVHTCDFGPGAGADAGGYGFPGDGAGHPLGPGAGGRHDLL